MKRKTHEWNLAQSGKGVPSSESGLGYLTLLVFGLIIAALLYTAFHVLPFYYYFYDFQNQMESMIRVASVETDETIKKRLLYFMHKYQIPARDEALRINRSGDEMEISLKYTEVFYVPWQGKVYEIRRFPFHAKARGRIPKS